MTYSDQLHWSCCPYYKEILILIDWNLLTKLFRFNNPGLSFSNDLDDRWLVRILSVITGFLFPKSLFVSNLLIIIFGIISGLFSLLVTVIYFVILLLIFSLYVLSRQRENNINEQNEILLHKVFFLIKFIRKHLEK